MNKNQDESRCPIFNNFIEEHGKIWFWALNFNALFQGSIAGGIATSVWGLGQSDEMYGKIVKCGHKIIGIPTLTNNILVYDISTEEARLIPIPVQDWGNIHALERDRFWDGVVWGNYVFMIGNWSAKVLKFDVVNESIVDVIDLYEGLDIPFERRFLTFKNALVVDNKVLIPSYVTNCVIVLEPNDMKYEKIAIEKCGNGFSDIVYDGGNVWLSPRERGQFVKWNMQKKEITLHDNYPTEFHMKNEANIAVMRYCNGKVFVFPYRADKVFSIETAGDNVRMYAENVFNHYYENLKTHQELMKYMFAQNVGKRLYSFCTENRRILSYDTESGALSELKFLISDEDYLYFDLWRCRILMEDYCNVSLLIKLLSNKDVKYDVNNEDTKNSVGEEIYKRIKRDRE